MTALSRRDVAAMRLALECLRRDIWHADHEDAFAALRAGDARAYGLAHDAWTAWWRMFRREACADHRDIMREKQRTWRLLRARLALALRVLLRVDAGDYGPSRMRCDACGWSERVEEAAAPDDPARERWRLCDAPPYEWLAPVRAPWAIDRSIRPLWERATAHDGTTPAMRRQR